MRARPTATRTRSPRCRWSIRDLIGLGAGEDGATVDDALGALIERAESAESERVWLRSRLSVLADVSREEDRDRTIPLIEVAGAAARVLAAAAADRPVVVAIEDLHWSEQALRESLSTIVDDADAPIVVLCTARPELFDADAGWGGGRSNSTTLRLVPLTDLETTTLVESLLRASILTETERDSILRNIGGNPLFAVEFVRMLVDRRLTEAEVPMSVQAVIGARLDSVSPELRTMLQDAAVVGARFWPDALLAIGDTSSAGVRGALAELSRRGLIQRSSDSWFPDQAEYAFGHALIREVAYARLPRMARATKHAAVGIWLSEEVRDRPDAFADALAHHFEQAVLLAEASGEREEADAWRGRAVDNLFRAGELSLQIDPAGAFVRMERALAVGDPSDPGYARALAYSALAGRRSGKLTPEKVLRRHERALAMHHDRGDHIAEARSHTSVAGQLMALARHDEASEHLKVAAELLADEPNAGPELALVHAWMAEERMFAGLPGPAAEFASMALDGNEANESTAIMALHIRGDSRIALGDPDGIDDLQGALARSQALGSVSDVVTSFSYLADREWQVTGPAAAIQLLDEASELADRRGAFSQGSWTKVAALELLYELGRWDEALTRAEPLASDARMDESLQVAIDVWTGYIRLRRGKYDDDVDELLVRARNAAEMQVIAPALALAAEASADAGDVANATALLTEWEERTAGRSAMYRSNGAPSVVRSALAIGARELAETVVARSETVTMRDHVFIDTAAAVVRDADPETWAQLEERWRAYGNRLRAGARRAGARAGGRARRPPRAAVWRCCASSRSRPRRPRRLRYFPPDGSRRGSGARGRRGAERGVRRQRGQGLPGLGGRNGAEHRRARRLRHRDVRGQHLDRPVVRRWRRRRDRARDRDAGHAVRIHRRGRHAHGDGHGLGALRLDRGRRRAAGRRAGGRGAVGADRASWSRRSSARSRWPLPRRSGLDSRRTPRPFRRRSRRSGRRGSRSRSSASPTCGSAAAVG